MRADDPLEDARRLVVRAFMGFGSDSHNSERRSGFRANSLRNGTAAQCDWRHFPEALDAIIERLCGVVIEHRPAVEVIRGQDSPQTLHYCDPPYVWSTRSMKSHSMKCYAHEMTDDEHRALAQVLHEVEGMVVLSGYASALYDELYGAWVRAEREALADGARRRTEVLWLSPRAWEALQATGSLFPGI